MSVNKHLPHVLVLPEDDANRQIANGFSVDSSLDIRRIQILEEAGGWTQVVDTFKTDHVKGMEALPKRFMVLLQLCSAWFVRWLARRSAMYLTQ